MLEIGLLTLCLEIGITQKLHNPHTTQATYHPRAIRLCSPSDWIPRRYLVVRPIRTTLTTTASSSSRRSLATPIRWPPTSAIGTRPVLLSRSETIQTLG